MTGASQDSECCRPMNPTRRSHDSGLHLAPRRWMAFSSRSFLIFAWASLSLALAVSGCQGSLARADGAANDGGDPATLTCTVATECTRTEIDHEILTAADCPCLYGCAFTIVNVETANRRMAQYTALCTPGRDGKGNSCGIDDCIAPAPLACLDQRCVVESVPF